MILSQFPPPFSPRRSIQLPLKIENLMGSYVFCFKLSEGLSPWVLMFPSLPMLGLEHLSTLNNFQVSVSLTGHLSKFLFLPYAHIKILATVCASLIRSRSKAQTIDQPWENQLII